ncbi:hypothetical protein DFH08DRAFT_888167 [Mycena albidolilacea]|uniref:Secreted protein n=1 Tax=Mycena albidolilacea TaxID=1033008 RepID=A0AAD6ZHA3_9AGAR|nr:hypothetical protein DFH08DRAFT_888167 [Mycena albidolilacea]
MFVVLVLVLGADAGVDAGRRDPATAPSQRGGRLGHRFIPTRPSSSSSASSSTSVVPLLTPEVQLTSCAGALGRCEPLALAA